MIVLAYDCVTQRLATLDGDASPSVGGILTSHPYPIEVIEGLNVGSNLTRGLVSPYSFEALDIAVTLVSGSLRTPRHDISPTEALDVGATLVSGVLKVVRVDTASTEALDVGATLISGVLKQHVFNTANEALDVSATLISGTLA